MEQKEMCGSFWGRLGLKLAFSASHGTTAPVLLFTGIHQPQQDQIRSIKESMDFLTTRSYGSEI